MKDKDLVQAHDYLDKHDWQFYHIKASPHTGPTVMVRWCSGCCRMQTMGDGEWTNAAAFGLELPDADMVKLMLDKKIISVVWTSENGPS